MNEKTDGGAVPLDELTDYISSLEVTQGQGIGEPFRLLPWERRFVRGAFATDHDAALSVARGNGKTCLVSALGCSALEGPLAKERGEVLIVASSFDQARIAFDHSLSFLKAKHGARHMGLKKLWRIWDTAQQARVTNERNGAKIRAIGSDPRRAHGAAPSLILADEPAQWERGKLSGMISALETSLGKIPGSRMIVLGTRPSDDLHFFSLMLRGQALGGIVGYAQCHAARAESPALNLKGDPLFWRRTWHKANPSLKYFPTLLKRITEEAKYARLDPGLLASFKALRLNMGTSDVADRDMLCTPEAWEACLQLDIPPRGGEPTWGIDLGGAQAMSSVSSCWPGGRLETLSMFGGKPNLKDRAQKDGVEGLYNRAVQSGELMVSKLRIPDIPSLLNEARERFGLPALIVCDLWRLPELRDAMDQGSGWKGIPVVKRRQGFKDGAASVRAWRTAVIDRRIAPVRPCILLTNALAHAVTISDSSGNEKLAKSSQGGRRQSLRDDVVAASLLAVEFGIGSKQPKSAYGGII